MIKIKKIIASNFFVTLSATMIGVFFAIYANDLAESKKIKGQKEVAINNLIKEILSNRENIQTSLKKHIQIYEILSFLEFYTDFENKITTSVTEMSRFRAKYPYVIAITDSIPADNNNYRYSGKVKLDFSIPQLNITNVSWSTIKNSGLTNYFNFECLKHLESINKMENEISFKNKRIFEYLLESNDVKNRNRFLIRNLDVLISFEESLLDVYKQKEDILKYCK